MSRRNHDFQTIRSEGGLLPSDLLRRPIDPQGKLEGTRPEDYGLPQGERLNEAITQSWNRLSRHWKEFKTAFVQLPEGEPGTGVTNEKWTLPLLRELGFGLLPSTPGPEVAGRTYAISRFMGPVPIHLVGCGLSLDRRAAGVRGAAVANPHGLVQEYLNRSDGHLWGIVSNGMLFRILRDSQALSRQSFLELDLQTMFDGEVYSDFVLFWLLAHATRFAPREGDRVETCWLEVWTKIAQEQGTRALQDLRGGVERALKVLGEGFTSHPRNTDLRDSLRTGKTPLADFHGQLLRVVYRLIFLFVAEDRTIDGLPLLHPPERTDATRSARELYAANYSAARLRDLASQIKGSRHGDLWRQLQLIVGALSGEAAFAPVREHLALPALGSFLWNPDSTSLLNKAEITNHDFLEALRNLAFTSQGKALRPVDYKNLGAEELGGVYESLLALTPQISADGASFTFAEFSGNERKTSGSYYTPDSLVQCLLDSALDPVVEEAIKDKNGEEAEKAILALKVCDPAVGSGHFLVGAAHRLARHLSRVRALAQGESEPSPLLYQRALRDVIGRCLYGVDINPMAAELCRVSLWLEALEPGKPLSFLDHHIRVGNSLLGATPELIKAGLPDEAFDPIEGDEKKICSALKKRNKKERDGQMDMGYLMAAEPKAIYGALADRAQGIDEAPDGTIEEISRKAERFEELLASQESRHAKVVADAWCAAFVWKKQAGNPAEPLTTDTHRRLEAGHSALTEAQRAEVECLLRHYQFFHWHQVFPEVFSQGGFACVLGNPPWERVKLQEKEWFAKRSPEISGAQNAAARRRMIEDLKTGNPDLFRQFVDDSRKAEGESHLMRNSGRYPLCGVGDTNTYAIFAELGVQLIGKVGAAAQILPIGIVTDMTTKDFFGHLVRSKILVEVFGFINEEMLFKDVLHNFKFCILVMGSIAQGSKAPHFVFNSRNVVEAKEPSRGFTLTGNDIKLLNPITETCPIFFTAKSAEATKKIFRSHPILDSKSGKSGWMIEPFSMLHMGNASELFSIESEGDSLPVFEAKMINQYNHRYSSFGGLNKGERSHMLPETPEEKLQDPNYSVEPCYFVPKGEVLSRISGKVHLRWLVATRRIASAGLARTGSCSVVPIVGAGDSITLLGANGHFVNEVVFFVAMFNSIPFDFCLRQKLAAATINFFVLQQLPVVPKDLLAAQAPWDGSVELSRFVVPRVLELMFTAWDLEPFARDCGWSGPPFCWNENRRFMLRCELDAAFFHLYLSADAEGSWRRSEGECTEDYLQLKDSFSTPREAVTYILDTFPIVMQKDEEKWGEFRTKRVILEIYDAMQEAIRTGQPYQTRLDPPPADPRCCHPPREAAKS